METDDQIVLPTREAVESAENVYHAVQRVFPEAVAEFESKWTAFQDVCNSQPISASPNECVRTHEFETLKKQGPKIIAFVVFKLAIDVEQHSYGVFLFNALENNPKYRGNLDDHLISKEALQRRSSQIVELSCQRNKVYEELVKLWKEHCSKFLLLLNRGVCCDCEEYWDLLEVGPAFIPHLMVEYSRDQDGYWYELLHEIIHGRGMGAYMFVAREKLFDVWREFLNKGEYDQAPRYIPNEWDIYFTTKKMGPQVREYFRQFDV